MSPSFQDWLIDNIRIVLDKPLCPPPFLLWCDPEQEWLGLLQDAAAIGDLELWANPDEHELTLRNRFYAAPPASRVVWVPRAFKDLTWFKVLALQAGAVWRTSLIQALRDYGVIIPREHESALKPLLPAHAREWFDQPREVWKELTPGAAKGTLLDDRRMLQALAGAPGEFDRLRQEERLAIFARRAVEDFGLPDPTDRNEADWRVAAMAALLCTEAAAAASGREQPGDGDRIIPPGLSRDRAIKLLKDWQANVHYIPRFETLVVEADKTLGLAYWARNLDRPPNSFSSRAVEDALFQQSAEQLDHLENVEHLAQTLAEQLPRFKVRAAGFWGSLASHKVGWAYLVQLAEAASLLVENADAEQRWHNVKDAVDWYQSRGWQLDGVGETLFEEQPDLPDVLHRIRARLRRVYLRTVDRLGREFSALLEHQPRDVFELPTAGELALQELEQSTEPTALVLFDALRLELGYRLAELLNAGEPVRRATVRAAVAPVPSITSLGMAFALPLKRNQLQVDVAVEKGFRIKAVGLEGDLTQAETRRKWLAANFEVKKFLTIAEVLDSDQLRNLRRLPRLLVVHGAEFDIAGHEGQLSLTGAAEHLERYAQAVRKLREAGFGRVIVVTDHGFFHWQPETDEVEDIKPLGDVRWLSRRAAVGQDLASATAVQVPVMQSQLKAMVPRSVNAFKTYGGLGFFHGGATLQELLIPVLVVRWPAKAAKTTVVLKPVTHITSQVPRLEVEAGLQGMTLFGPDEKLLARRVLVKVRNPETGTLVFRHSDPVTIEPGGQTVIVELQLVEPPPVLLRGAPLVVEVCDADDEEILVRENVLLGIDVDEW